MSSDGERLHFLDLLRGVAALAVVIEHGLWVSVPGYLGYALQSFDVGQFGVTLFFLVSGFIIPVSLERGGSSARFWAGRFFRLFPLYWATIAFFWLYYLLIDPPSRYPTEPWQWLANLTMLQELVRAPHVTPVFWTLTLELAFYASCSLLHALGLFRRAWLLPWLGVAALLLFGVLLPLASGQRFPAGYAFLFLTFFVGLAFRRFSTGELSRAHLLGLLASLAPVSLAAAYVCFELRPRPEEPIAFHCAWSVWLAAYACFAAALAWRARLLPSSLCYLGKISYSLYLMHTCLVLALPRTWPAAGYVPTLLAGSVALSALSYRWIEVPGQRLGRRLLRGHEGRRAEETPAHRLAA
jgi:peptidoglycan/LPS O-acetylase OafA/YrhL